MHVNIIISLVDMIKLYVNIIMQQVDILVIHLACMGRSMPQYIISRGFFCFILRERERERERGRERERNERTYR